MNQRPFDFDGDYGAGYEELALTVIPGYLSSFRLGLALLQGRLPPDARVLVVGAGTGIEIVTFKSAEPGWRFTGVDPSAQMIEIARRRVTEAGLERGVRLHRGTVGDLGPEERGFSAATCYNVLHFLPDDGAKGDLLRGIAARLAPDASLILFDLHGDRSAARFVEQYAAWRRYWALQGMEDDARDTFQAELEAGIHWIPESRILELLAETGFVGVQRFFGGLLYGGWSALRAPEA